MKLTFNWLLEAVEDDAVDIKHIADYIVVHKRHLAKKNQWFDEILQLGFVRKLLRLRP